jgi:hypothetical protein
MLVPRPQDWTEHQRRFVHDRVSVRLDPCKPSGSPQPVVEEVT